MPPDEHTTHRGPVGRRPGSEFCDIWLAHMIMSLVPLPLCLQSAQTSLQLCGRCIVHIIYKMRHVSSGFGFNESMLLVFYFGH